MTESEATLNDEIYDDEAQLIRLCLKKPKQWNWELTTSKSSSNITFPTIQLFDENNNHLLAEASESGFVASSKLRKARSSTSVSNGSSLRSVRTKDSYRIKIKRNSINEIEQDPIITEPDDAPAPVQIHSERGLLLRDANAKEFKKSNEKPRTRPYSRSSSASMRSRSSVSILERIRELKRSSSSDESEIENEVEKHKKRYSYRSCTLGTILVPKESFSNVRRRPKRVEEMPGESIH